MANFTKKAIIETFIKLLNEKPLSKITVTEIIETCGISRNTFYYYFQDIYDLVDYLFNKEIQRIKEITSSTVAFTQECEIVLEFLINNKTALKHIYQSVKRNQLEIYLYETLEKGLIDFIKKRFKDIDINDEDIQFLIRYHKYALAGFIIDWLASDSDEELRNLIKRISTLSEDIITSDLKNTIKIIKQ